ncbi:MADF domain-containing protein [Aphelenchoides besseyi]|nr:MADF domain-containing protein [Aphelenchoides besseyi]
MSEDLLLSIFPRTQAKQQRRTSRRFYVRPDNLNGNNTFAVFYTKYESADPTDFKNFVGVSREQFDQMLAIIGEKLTCKKRHLRPVPVEVRLAIFLRYRTVPNISMNSIAREFGVGYSTVHMIWKQVSETLNLPTITTETPESPVASPKSNDETEAPTGEVWSKTWTDREREVLIEEIRKRPHLYDLNDPLYKAKERRVNAFEEIGGEISRQMGYVEPIEGRYVASQWKILKDTFNRTRRSLSGPRSSEAPVWRFYNRMLFLAQTDSSTSDTLKSADSRAPSTSAIDFFSGAIDLPWAQGNIDLQSLLPAAAAAIANHTDSPTSIDESPESAVGTSSSFDEFGLEDFIVNVVQRRILDTKQEKDEFDSFGKMVTTTLRNLARVDISLAQEMRADINQIIYRYGTKTDKK